MPFQALAAAATLLTMAPHGNRIELQLDRGSAEVLWASSGTFRFRRLLEGALPKIEWTDHTFNPWIGCQHVSPGCDHCYAETQNKFRRWNGGSWGPHSPRKRTSEANWKNPLRWNKSASSSGLRLKVFCASLADWLDNKAPR